jgi:hypothetical protein
MLKGRMYVTLAAVGLGLAVALPACGGSGSVDKPCIILADGGNKLCGDDAVTWCDTTAGERKRALELASDPEFGDPSTASEIRQAQADCKAIGGDHQISEEDIERMTK